MSSTNDSLAMGVNVTVEVHDAATGALVHSEQVHNLVTRVGMNAVRDALNGSQNSIGITHVAVGTGSAVPSEAHTGLGTEVNRGTTSQRIVTDGSLTIQRFLGSQDVNGQTLVEAGLFIGTLMFARATFNPLTKSAAATVTLTWTITIGNPPA